MLRMTVLMGYVFYFTGPAAMMFDFFFRSKLLLGLAYGLLYPFIQIGKVFFAIGKLMHEFLLPLITLVRLTVQTFTSLIWNVFSLPFNLCHGCFLMVYSGLSGFFRLLQGFGTSIKGMFAVMRTVDTTAVEARETVNVISHTTQMTLMWSTSLTNQLITMTKQMLGFIKSATAFLAHVLSEYIGKHSYSITLYL